jgi:6-phosphogluconolactonase
MTPQQGPAYDDTLRVIYGADRLDPARPLFDVNLLGLGSNGHTASLLPGTAVLAECNHWVAAVFGAEAEPRITLTYPAPESSRHAAFLVAGSDKHATLAWFRSGDDSLPAARLPPTGYLWIFSDAAAETA